MIERQAISVDFSNQVQTWLNHIRVLALEIGPRGPTTAGERHGSEYCRSVLQQLELPATLESFLSARSIFLPHLLASIGMLIAFAIYPLADSMSAAVAALIALITLVSDLLELGFRNNLLRWLMPKSPSQNAVAVLPPDGEHKQDLVLIGHVDSQRTPLIFKTPRWLAIYKSFTTVAFIAFAAQVLLYILGIFTQWTWIWPVSGVSALCAVLLAVMCIQADLTPFTHGANDNATAAGLVLTLAAHLKDKPLKHTRVWLVCTGCEEVQHYGAIDFFRRHTKEMLRPKTLVFEMLGCDGPAWLTKEGIIVPFYADPEMIQLAVNIAKQYPKLNGYPVTISGGNTEMADALRLDIPAITLTGMSRSGVAPYWHMVGDTFDKIYLSALARNYAFTWHFIQALDACSKKT
jgi:hypothetical protein